MFTGIVEEIGRVSKILYKDKSGSIEIKASRVTENTRQGDSIAVNGVCLTVTRLLKDGFTADVMMETVRTSSLSELNNGDSVNLERALPPMGRLGGHIVTGHIDATGKIAAYKREENAVWIEIITTKEAINSMVHKGSVAIDGVSLTISRIDSERFAVSIIPHTAEQTTLISKKVGDAVNIENDIIGKYVKRFLEIPKSKQEEKTSDIDMEFLLKNGF